MATFDDYVTPFEKEGKALPTGDIEFSQHTYQVEVFGGEEALWPFIQFGEGNVIQDAFCSCDSEETSCPHLAAACLRIYDGQSEPLHVRFDRSLWKRITEIFADRQGYGTDILEKVGEGHYQLKAHSGKVLFSVRGSNVEAMIEERVKETEETSLKFSGLSTEELALWREGRPSPFLRYELSFWADLAKRMMLATDYQVTFETTKEGVPTELCARFPDLEVMFYISKANLSAIIPTLSTIEAPLKVHDVQDEGIESIVYEVESGSLLIKTRKQAVPREGVELEDWTLVPGDGFYSRQQQVLLGRDRIGPEEVGKVLSDHGPTIAHHLKGLKIYSEPVTPSYTIGFDTDWNLHIQCHLFEVGDLQGGRSRFLGNWVYLDGDGFYPLEGALFEEVERIVPPKAVSDFVHRHRAFLNTQEGFHTHLTTVDSTLSYEVADTGELRFESRIDLPQGAEEGRDFGEWVYITSQGFYSKAHGRSLSPVSTGGAISKAEVAAFIKENREDLELLEGFFTTVCPVKLGMLKITLTAREHIKIRPKYELHSDYRQRDVVFYEDFVYLRGHGFSEIPTELRLPERFAKPLTIKGQELLLFLTYELPSLRPYISSLDPRLERVDTAKLIVGDAKRGRGKVSLELTYTSFLGGVSAIDLWGAISKRRPFLFSDAGLIDLKHPRFQWLRQLPEARIDQEKSLVRLSTLEFIRLMVLEELQAAPDATTAQELIERFSSFEAPKPADFTGLTSTLRPYQKTGAEWLWFLYCNHLSGLLCDDMGLGKTHQAMALLAAVHNTFSHHTDKSAKYLVVCPTSVIYHWRQKLARFLPGACVYTFYGASRNLKNSKKCDVLLTSYGVLRSEREEIAKLSFEVAVFDEIQVAKNYASQTHAALTKVQARMRLGLTGTPIENSLRELKALFDVVLPTYFPPERQFREYFILPIEKEGDEGRKAMLRRVCAPFLLRRKKEEVLTELPEKTEEKAECELSQEQRTLYNMTLSRSKERLIRDLENKEQPTPYVHIFALLSTLKQICDHPAVHLKKPQDYKQHKSGKFELFVELLSQARESQQKVVIFSHYLSMLDIIEAYLKDQGIGFATIRGSTSNRDKQMERFEKDPNCEVFLGSLQAAGLGIDLTAASVVIHYDRWWNAARENQATDRVHRLGQMRGVQVFKLLTIGTLEERIDRMIEAKGQLMEDIVASDEQSQLKSFTREELIELLALADQKPIDS